MFGVTSTKPEPMHTSVESMLTWMRQYGHPVISVAGDDWYCYFNYKHGPMSMKIEASGDRKAMSLHENVESCYLNVKRTIASLQGK